MTADDLRTVMQTRRAEHLPREADAIVDHLLAVRTSCRGFTADVVDRQTICDILTTAQLTASWCNSQSWEVSVVTGAGTDRLRSALGAAARGGHVEKPDIEFPREYRGVHRDRRRESGFALYNALGITRGEPERQQQQMLRNFDFFGAPHVAIIHADEALGPYGAVDCGGYIANFLLAATARGVATVAQAALAMYPEVLRSELGLTSDRNIVCGISFGYADLDHASNDYRTSRASIDEVVIWVDR